MHLQYYLKLCLLTTKKFVWFATLVSKTILSRCSCIISSKSVPRHQGLDISAISHIQHFYTQQHSVHHHAASKSAGLKLLLCVSFLFHPIQKAYTSPLSPPPFPKSLSHFPLQDHIIIHHHARRETQQIRTRPQRTYPLV